MKIICKRQSLVEAVSNVQRAVSSKSTLPALEGILLKTNSQAVELCGYDLELGITTFIKAEVQEEGEIVLAAKLFSDIVRRLPGDSVTITVDEKLIVGIQSGVAEFSIVGITSSEYPELPSVQGATPLSMTHALFQSMIKQTLFAVADTDSKPIHTGTLFEICLLYTSRCV